MKSSTEEETNFYLIAKRISTQQKITLDSFQQQIQSKIKNQSDEALKIINAYRKVENIKPNFTNKNQSIPEKQTQTTNINNQPKSTYATKIKQTLRQLNANKAKQFQKLNQKRTELNDQKNINSLKISSRLGFKSKSEAEKKLILKSTQKVWQIFFFILKRKLKQGFQQLELFEQIKLQKDYQMARKYRLFRLFCIWKQETSYIKEENQKKKMQQQKKQIQGIQMARQFYIFKTEKKVFKNWSKMAINQKKKRKYQEEIAKIEFQQQIKTNKAEIQTQNIDKQNKQVKILQNQTDLLQNKLKGFLDGLKEKIENKDQKKKTSSNQVQKKQLRSIEEQSSESQRSSNIYSRPTETQYVYQQELNQRNLQCQQVANIGQEQQLQPQKPISNDQLQKKRQQIYERSKNRKQALQKLKKQKQLIKQKEQQQRKQLEKKIEEQQKKIKELKYKQFQQRKKLEKQWQIKEIQLNEEAQIHNSFRLKKYYGFLGWKKLKIQNSTKAQKLQQTLLKVMTKHAGTEFFDNMKYNIEKVLNKIYSKMQLTYSKNLMKKCLKGFKNELSQCLQQKIKLQAINQVHTLKIFLNQWKRVLDVLRLQNMEQQRPLIRKANEYHQILLLMKSIRGLKENAVERKKQKNINEQKNKIKSKIKNIISEKIQINFDEFL